MIGIPLCAAALLSSFIAGRRSLGSGLAVAIVWGYFYGILRAYFAGSGAYFIFDSALVGLYVAYFVGRTGGSDRWRIRNLRCWAIILIVWPVLLVLLPFQPAIISLVGLRAHILAIPMLLIGARLRDEDLSRLSATLAGLNIVILIVAVIEYTIGLERIFPQNNVTQLMFQMNDVANHTAYRIPATFSQAHVYAGTMICTIPFLFGAWAVPSSKDGRFAQRVLMIGLAAGLFGILLAAARMAFVLAAAIITFATLTSSLGTKRRLGLCATILCIAGVTLGNERLQRFTMLRDTDAVESRIAGSVNRTILEVVVEYPIGNGLGGGGTSIPYFLEQYVKNPVFLENEYARIALETSLFGLLLWIAFLVWVFTSSTAFVRTPWRDARRVAWFTCLLFFCSGMIGVGLFTAVPQNVLIFSMIGWFSVKPPAALMRPTGTLRRGARVPRVQVSTVRASNLSVAGRT